LILGTRLAAIDVVVLAETLLRKNPHLKSYSLTMASKEGVLPMVRVPPASHKHTQELKFINEANIKQEIEKSGHISM
jgi:uncharacterized NAD(P)/FAD-binding protein YdhS